MEEDATSTERPHRVICPNAVITSTIRVSPQTRRFIKTLSALMGIPILSRGKSSLDEVAYYTKKAGFTSFLVVFSRRGVPSRIDVYKLMPKGYFKPLGYILMRGFEIYRKPPAYIGTHLILNGDNEVSRELWRMLISAFGNDSCSKYSGNISKCEIEDYVDEAVMCFWMENQISVKIFIRNVKFQKE